MQDGRSCVDIDECAVHTPIQPLYRGAVTRECPEGVLDHFTTPLVNFRGSYQYQVIKDTKSDEVCGQLCLADASSGCTSFSRSSRIGNKFGLCRLFNKVLTSADLIPHSMQTHYFLLGHGACRSDVGTISITSTLSTTGASAVGLSCPRGVLDEFGKRQKNVRGQYPYREVKRTPTDEACGRQCLADSWCVAFSRSTKDGNKFGWCQLFAGSTVVLKNTPVAAQQYHFARLDYCRSSATSTSYSTTASASHASIVPSTVSAVPAGSIDVQSPFRSENTTRAPACSKQAFCRNTIGSFQCTCKDGYTGDGVNCMPIMECAFTGNSAVCHPHAECIDTDDSYICVCKAGWEGNGTSCTAITTTSSTVKTTSTSTVSTTSLSSSPISSPTLYGSSSSSNSVSSSSSPSTASPRSSSRQDLTALTIVLQLESPNTTAQILAAAWNEIKLGIYQNLAITSSLRDTITLHIDLQEAANRTVRAKIALNGNTSPAKTYLAFANVQSIIADGTVQVSSDDPKFTLSATAVSLHGSFLTQSQSPDQDDLDYVRTCKGNVIGTVNFTTDTAEAHRTISKRLWRDKVANSVGIQAYMAIKEMVLPDWSGKVSLTCAYGEFEPLRVVLVGESTLSSESCLALADHLDDHFAGGNLIFSVGNLSTAVSAGFLPPKCANQVAWDTQSSQHVNAMTTQTTKQPLWADGDPSASDEADSDSSLPLVVIIAVGCVGAALILVVLIFVCRCRTRKAKVVDIGMNYNSAGSTLSFAGFHERLTPITGKRVTSMSPFGAIGDDTNTVVQTMNPLCDSLNPILDSELMWEDHHVERHAEHISTAGSYAKLTLDGITDSATRTDESSRFRQLDSLDNVGASVVDGQSLLDHDGSTFAVSVVDHSPSNSSVRSRLKLSQVTGASGENASSYDIDEEDYALPSVHPNAKDGASPNKRTKSFKSFHRRDHQWKSTKTLARNLVSMSTDSRHQPAEGVDLEPKYSQLQPYQSSNQSVADMGDFAHFPIEIQPDAYGVIKDFIRIDEPEPDADGLRCWTTRAGDERVMDNRLYARQCEEQDV